MAGSSVTAGKVFTLTANVVTTVTVKDMPYGFEVASFLPSAQLWISWGAGAGAVTPTATGVADPAGNRRANGLDPRGEIVRIEAMGATKFATPEGTIIVKLLSSAAGDVYVGSWMPTEVHARGALAAIYAGTTFADSARIS